MTRMDDPALAAWLVERYGVEGEQAGLLDEDLVVGYAEDRLSAEERAAVERLLARDPEARALLGLTEPPPPAASAAAEARRTWVWPVAVAAAVLVALGAALWSPAGPEPLPGDGEERLLVLADRLAAAEPARFGGLRNDIRAAAPIEHGGGDRGGVRIRAPHGLVLDGAPTLRWEAVPGAGPYTLRIAAEDGDPVYETTVAAGTQHALPTGLAPGAYVFEVRTQTPFGPASGSSTFRRADDRARAAYEQAIAAIDAVAPPEDRLLLRTYHLATRGWFAAAREALAAHRRRYPEDERAARAARMLGPRED